MNATLRSVHSTTGRWISFRRERPDARLRLFCLPYAGGGASAYRRWPSLFPEAIEVCPVQPPGRENRIREEPLRRAAVLVEALDEAMVPLLDRPFALFGYSMGATIAFEWAQTLKARGLAPELLVVAARAAPHTPRSVPAMYDLPDEELKTRLHELAGTAPEIIANDELMEILLPMLRADFEIHDTYRPTTSEPLSCPVVALGGHADDAVPEEHLRMWSDTTSESFAVHFLPGDHFSLLRGDRLPQQVARILRPLTR